MYFFVFWSYPKVFSNGNIVFDDSKEFDEPQVSDVISNKSMDFNDPHLLNDPQAIDDPKGILIENRDFENPKVYGDTSIFDSLVFSCNSQGNF